MKVPKTIRIILILTLLIANIGCDQIAKNFARQKIDYNEQISVAGKFITLTRVENTGAFLGLGNSMPRLLYKILMIFLPLIVIGYALWYILAKEALPKLLIAGILLIIGGGLGNIYDRIIFGSVTDFMQFDFLLFRTGIVNFADISVTTGFFILLFEFYYRQRKVNTKTSVKEI